MLSEKASAFMVASKSDNTRKAYLADWLDFVAYCEAVGADCLPAEADTVANYLADRAGTLAPATLTRRLTTIAMLHDEMESPPAINPARSASVRLTLAGIRRTYGVRQQCKAPLMYGDLKKLCHGNFFHGWRGKRDKALLLLGFAAALRRSELVAVRVEDVTFTDEGLMLLIPRSKSDQLGAGEVLAVPFFGDLQACPVRALKDWLTTAGIKSGCIFRAISDSCRLSAGLSAGAVADIVKKYAAALRLNPADYAGHSLRRGFATDAAAHGATLPELMHHTRHKSERQALKYIEAGTAFKDTPCRRLEK